MTCLYDTSSSEQFIFKNENLIELLFGESEKKIPLKSDSLPLYMYSIYFFRQSQYTGVYGGSFGSQLLLHCRPRRRYGDRRGELEGGG